MSKKGKLCKKQVEYYDKLRWYKNKQGYYTGSRVIDRSKKLHQYIWEKFKGKVPIGYVIHHIDENKSNNFLSNLQILTKSAHTTIHKSGVKNAWYGKKGKDHPRYGTHRTEDEKRRISEKMSIIYKGKGNPMYGKCGKLNPTSKKVLCVETGISYGSICEAARELGIIFQNISKVCKGERHTAGGFHWEFL